MRVVIALGGNALLRRGQPLEAEVQRVNIQAAAVALAEVARDHDVVVTHGNGPQVGLLALQAEAFGEVPPYPLDVLGAESEGEPFLEIVKKADELQVHAIVMGKYGARGKVERMLFGSTAERVIRASTRPVLVLPLERTEQDQSK